MVCKLCFLSTTAVREKNYFKIQIIMPIQQIKMLIFFLIMLEVEYFKTNKNDNNIHFLISFSNETDNDGKPMSVLATTTYSPRVRLRYTYTAVTVWKPPLRSR